ncbi:MAG: rhamnulokinase [Oscillospiraceae bacterium]|nr:rhamnulokinase [Oscillospiraceae bacterium]
MEYCLAIDIGASGGRHILGSIQSGRLETEEIYRFENGMENREGSLLWDTERLLSEVKNGLARCREIGKIPATVAIDTWGVDYVLLDEEKKTILPVYAYRDGRTKNAVSEAEGLVGGGEALYARTGIQTQSFNTIYQLHCHRGALAKARHFLMMPEYLSYALTGVMKNEYTNATTTNLVNAEGKAWDEELLKKLGIDSGIFKELTAPPAAVGRFSPEIAGELGFDALVLLCPSHDTASAVAACPISENGIFISSGTWSLIGTEVSEPVLSDAARKANFTNEGGIDYRFRFLKNIMGMWLLQGLRRSLDKKYTYDEMMNMAMESDFTETFDPNAPELNAPEDMLTAVRGLLSKPELPVKDVLSSVYHSLAASYARAVREIEDITGKVIDSVTIMGGGSKDGYLNSLTREYTGKRVLAGPTEATAIGNLLSQFMYLDKDLTLEAGRELIKKSFNIQEVV